MCHCSYSKLRACVGLFLFLLLRTPHRTQVTEILPSTPHEHQISKAKQRNKQTCNRHFRPVEFWCVAVLENLRVSLPSLPLRWLRHIHTLATPLSARSLSLFAPLLWNRPHHAPLWACPLHRTSLPPPCASAAATHLLLACLLLLLLLLPLAAPIQLFVRHLTHTPLPTIVPPSTSSPSSSSISLSPTPPARLLRLLSLPFPAHRGSASGSPFPRHFHSTAFTRVNKSSPYTDSHRLIRHRLPRRITILGASFLLSILPTALQSDQASIQ